MTDAWKLLSDAGVPLGAPRTAGVPNPRLLPQALEEALKSEATADLTALWAWLRAFRQHWPRRFALVLGAQGPAALDQLAQRPVDANQYLKLRRIAVEQLSRW